MILDLRDAARSRTPKVTLLPHLVESAKATWRGRMINEHGSAQVFDALAAQIGAAGFGPDRVDEVRGFAAEERRHGVLCGAVVEALGGEACADVPSPEEVPAHADAASPLEAALRNVLSICCLSETVAVALIGAEREEMPDGELRELLTGIWADEVGHARFGWRLLDETARRLDAATRERLGDYLVVAFEHLVRHELAHLPVASAPPPEGAVLGLCSGRDARVLFVETVESVIVPALEARGLPSARAWARADARLSAAAWG